MLGLGKLIVVEAKLVVRDRITIPLVVALPILLVLAFGIIPDFSTHKSSLGMTGDQYIASLGVAICVAILGLMLLPSQLADYRERGILRRLAASPARPVTLLVARLVISAAAELLALALVLTVAKLAFGVGLPDRPGWFAVAFLLGSAAMISVGLLIAVLAPNGSSASGIAALTFFPSMFLAGAYVPWNQMPHVLQRISDFTPMSAALQTIRAAWLGQHVRPLLLVILFGYAVIATLVATKAFRWD